MTSSSLGNLTRARPIARLLCDKITDETLSWLPPTYPDPNRVLRALGAPFWIVRRRFQLQSQGRFVDAVLHSEDRSIMQNYYDDRYGVTRRELLTEEYALTKEMNQLLGTGCNDKGGPRNDLRYRCGTYLCQGLAPQKVDGGAQQLFGFKEDASVHHRKTQEQVWVCVGQRCPTWPTATTWTSTLRGRHVLTTDLGTRSVDDSCTNAPPKFFIFTNGSAQFTFRTMSSLARTFDKTRSQPSI